MAEEHEKIVLTVKQKLELIEKFDSGKSAKNWPKIMG
jgi:hypothetical protein